MIDILTGEVLRKVIDEAADTVPALADASVYKTLTADVSDTVRTIRIFVTEGMVTPNGTDPLCDVKDAAFLIQCFSRSDGDDAAAQTDAIQMAIAINDLIGANPELTFNGSPQVHFATTYPPDGGANMDIEISFFSNTPYGTAYLYGTINPL